MSKKRNSKFEEEALQLVDGMTNEEILEMAAFIAQPAPEIIERDFDQILSELSFAFDQGDIADPVVAFGMIQGTHTQTVACVNVSPDNCLFSIGTHDFRDRRKIEPHLAKVIDRKIGRQPSETMYAENMFLEINNDLKLDFEPFQSYIFSLPDDWFSMSDLREGLIRLHLTFEVNGKTVQQECAFFSVPNLHIHLAHVKKNWVLE